MAKRRKNKKKTSKYRPCSKSYKAKTFSSERTRHLQEGLQTSMNNIVGKHGTKFFHDKEDVKCVEINKHHQEKLKEIINNNETVYVNVKRNHEQDNNKDTFLNVNDAYFSKIDTTDPIACVDEEARSFVFYKDDRKSFINWDGLEVVAKGLPKLEKSKKGGAVLRGKKRKERFDDAGTTKKCNNVSVGTYAPRNKKGLEEKHIKDFTGTKHDIKAWHLAKRITTRIKSIFPTAFIRTMNNRLRALGLNPKWFNKDEKLKEIIINYLTSYCSGGNIQLPFHQDDDAFITALLVLRLCDFRKGKISHDSPIVKYFNFETGHSVGMRSGDLLLFNPMYFHCISGNLDNLDNADTVYSITFYLKTKVVSGNDNSNAFDK